VVRVDRCIYCGTDQVKRVRQGRWRILCKCRKCYFKIYDTLNYKEYKDKLHWRNILDKETADAIMSAYREG